MTPSFYPPTERFGGYSDEPGVRPSSVRPSVRPYVRPLTFSCPFNNLNTVLEYFDDTSQLCKAGHDDVSRTKMRALTLIFFELSPFEAFLCIFVSAL